MFFMKEKLINILSMTEHHQITCNLTRCMFFYDITLSSDKYGHMFGGSRLLSLSDVISTYVVLWEVLTEMYGNRGALNIISMGIKDSQMAGLPALKTEKRKYIEKTIRTFWTSQGSG